MRIARSTLIGTAVAWALFGQNSYADAPDGPAPAAASDAGAADLQEVVVTGIRNSVEESLEAIVKLQKAGKIRHIGLSEVKPKEIEQARKVAKIVSVQNLYNVSDRQHEDALEYCEKERR